jgi:hypothetical protein
MKASQAMVSLRLRRFGPVAVPVRIVVVELGYGARSIDVGLPDIPVRGDVLELTDGTRCRVQGVITAPADVGIVSHYVYATAVDVGERDA